MALSKSEFVIKLLDDKSINSQQRVKLFGLVARDFVNSEEVLTKIAEDVEEIKTGARLKEEEKPGNQENEKEQIKIKYLSPQQTSEFLYKFNEDPVLKSATHLVDANELDYLENIFGSSYTYDKHLFHLKKRFNKLKHKFTINKKLFKKISVYLNGGSNWSSDAVKINWSSSEILKWSKENDNKCPNVDEENLKYESFTLPEPIKIAGTDINTFSDLVLEFKKQIVIKEPNTFSANFKRWKTPYEKKANINIVSQDTGIILFTDVEKLKQAFNVLIKLCLAKSDKKPDISISFDEFKKDSNSKVIVSIHQTNTIYKRNQYDFDRLGQTYKNLIENQLNGICDFQVKAQLKDDTCHQKSVWPRKESTPISHFVGVQYNLIFYK